MADTILFREQINHAHWNFLLKEKRKWEWILYYSPCMANFLVKRIAFVLSVACIMMEPIFVDGICLKGQRWNKITALAAGAQQRSSKWKIWLKWSWSASFTLVGWHPKVIAGFHGEFYNSLRWWAHKLKLQKMDMEDSAELHFGSSVDIATILQNNDTIPRSLVNDVRKFHELSSSSTAASLKAEGKSNFFCATSLPD